MLPADGLSRLPRGSFGANFAKTEGDETWLILRSGLTISKMQSDASTNRSQAKCDGVSRISAN
jgi:hypothetical protein